MDIELKNRKSAQRSELKAALSRLSPENIQAKSLEICKRIEQLEVYIQAGAVMGYLAYGHEVNLDYLLASALKQGKAAAVPEVQEEKGKMRAVRLNSLENCIKKDKFGIRVPQDGAEVSPERLDLIILPGLGFDVQGGRLGKGGGYYDRFLSSDNVRGHLCGVCFEVQIVEQAASGDRDISADTIITEKRILTRP
ncbi:5-formyltetrahydrofolate cyclo-ligase family protein [Sedimentisphaera cyanobacteriorum]|uniref:5-formyltetrahydrofolate cyclo-ligase n=1 Tax=Sedimentisphaera cyanobacteriorum TaxID=1940790 RepID=A0A1Q2HQ72_9BACT|nr:5-formyltetrahydrofolate cyclo-ligase [Sedimentisphaera cyanobacteriorum]AQQ09578.1 5-formyltetrahydrofolate cyclo-ligase family protein [Sedimentisphaera cyanobacteriorum]